MGTQTGLVLARFNSLTLTTSKLLLTRWKVHPRLYFLNSTKLLVSPYQNDREIKSDPPCELQALPQPRWGGKPRWLAPAHTDLHMLNNTIDFVCAGRENPILKSHIDSHPLKTEQAAAFAKWIEKYWGQDGGVRIMSLRWARSEGQRITKTDNKIVTIWLLIICCIF